VGNSHTTEITLWKRSNRPQNAMPPSAGDTRRYSAGRSASIDCA